MNTPVKPFNFPTILVIFGATGDLMTKKIVPSLYHLFLHQTLPDHLRIIGCGRREMSDEQFQTKVEEILLKSGEKLSAKNKRFLQFFTYHQGDFENTSTFARLKEKLQVVENEWRVCTNKLYYLAVPPQSYAPILSGLGKYGLNKPCSETLGWSRVLIEKPFGHDFKSGRDLQKLLGTYFKEEQTYRIDHYLGKEMIQGVLHFRFSNNLFENAWNSKAIEKIDIRLWETIGVEDRGNFYDPVGAWKDVGQNHLLEMLAFLTMDYSGKATSAELRAAREKFFADLIPLTTEEIKKNTVRAQYAGYQTIPGVKKNSSTETYFYIQTVLKHPKWKGVPVTFESGKRMPQEKKEIVVTFKHPQVCYSCSIKKHFHNQVTFGFAPDDSITITFLTKKPGLMKDVEERKFNFFLYEKENHRPYVEEYAHLFLDCIRGDQSLFVGKREVEALWKFSDPISEAWEKNMVPLLPYEPDTDQAMVLAREKISNTSSSLLKKEVAIVGLGKMGAGLALNLLENSWKVVGYNRHMEATDELAKQGIIPSYSLEEMVQKLSGPRVVWLMVPAGKPVDDILFGKNGVIRFLKKGDIIIDGGNSFYKDTIKRAQKVKKFGIHFFDVGVSGGPSGARNGACLMIGGEKKVFEILEPLFRDISLPEAYQFFPGTGAGHFTKMIHNGIEYGMMQALAEGFAILNKSSYKINLEDAARIYNNGSVIESRLTNWLVNGFVEQGQELKNISGTVGHTGEGEWTVKTGKSLKVPTPVIEDSFQFRVQSEKHPSYTGKILSLLRNQFGQHAATVSVLPKKEKKKRK